MPALLMARDGPLRVRPGLDPAFLRWGVQFLAACRSTAVQRTVTSQLALAALSRTQLNQFTFDYGRRAAGKLVLYRTPRGFAGARATAAVDQDVQAPAECLALEPALRISVDALAVGIFTASEDVADCGAFCDGLAGLLRADAGVPWHLGARATPVLRGGRLVAVQAGGADVTADAFVLAFGSGAAAFARQAGVRLPHYPLKGYSLTVALNGPALRHRVTDLDAKTVYAPMGSEVRVAGIADMVGHNPALDAGRLGTLHRAAAATIALSPGADGRPWAGLSPATPGNCLLIGWSRVPGLFLNTGHGALGWTLFAGSVHVACGMLTGKAGGVQTDRSAHRPRPTRQPCHPPQPGRLLLQIRARRQRLLGTRIARLHIRTIEIGRAEQHVPPRQYRAVICRTLPGRQHAMVCTVVAR